MSHRVRALPPAQTVRHRAAVCTCWSDTSCHGDGGFLSPSLTPGSEPVAPLPMELVTCLFSELHAG